MTELEDLESQHASICRELHEGSEHPDFNRALAYRLRDELWERICELREQRAAELEAEDA
jgi:hypothetical protein